MGSSCLPPIALVQAEEEGRGLNEAQQAAEDEAALQAMREEGMLSDQPGPSQPQSGVLPKPPCSLPTKYT